MRGAVELGETANSALQGVTRVLPEKKRKREARIVLSASRLFARHGYAETSIEAIARDADVAVGTVYNYFRNKPALLTRVLTSGRSKALSASAALASDPPDEPVEAVCRLLIVQMRGANRHDKELWRVIHATAALEPEAFGIAYFIGKEQFTSHIIEMLQVLQGRGKIRSDIDIAIAARTIKYIASEVFRRYVADDRSSIESAIGELREMIRFLVDLLTKQSR